MQAKSKVTTPSSVPGERRAIWQTPLLLLLGLLCMCHGAGPLMGTSDFWAHAAVGRWIWQHGEVPRHTLFLWTASDPWVAHAWLSELALFGTLTAAGTWLTRMFVVLMASASFLLIWRLWRRHASSTTLMVILFGLAVNSSSHRFEARPELFSALFLSCLLVLLVCWTDSAATGWKAALPLLGLPVLFVVWVNCHAQVLLGLGLLGITVGCDLVQDRFSMRSRKLAFTGIVCAGTLLLNPYGVGYLQAYRATASVTFAAIREWQPFWAPPAMPVTTIVATLGLAVLAVRVWFASPRRRLAHLAWLLILCFSFLRACRFIWMLNLVSLTVLAASAEVVDVRRLWQLLFTDKKEEAAAEPQFRRLSWVVRIAVAVWLLVSLSGPLANLAVLQAWGDVVPRDMANFILERRVPGRIFNDYENASYFQWRFGGEPPLFIDLLNSYSDRVWLEYQEIVEATPRGLELLDQLDVGCIMLTRYRQGLSLDRLKSHLHQDERWKLVYANDDGYVFVRRSAPYEGLAEIDIKTLK